VREVIEVERYDPMPGMYHINPLYAVTYRDNGELLYVIYIPAKDELDAFMQVAHKEQTNADD
jgi:hypothetical protein